MIEPISDFFRKVAVILGPKELDWTLIGARALFPNEGAAVLDCKFNTYLPRYHSNFKFKKYI